MSLHPAESSPKVKVEEESHLGDSFRKMNKEEEPHPKYVSSQVKREDNFTLSGSTPPGNTLQGPAGSLPFEEEEEENVKVIEVDDDEDDQSYENASNQLVVYDPGENVPSGEIEPVPEPQVYEHPPYPSYVPHPHSRVLPSVGAFTVQCANCFKWRLIPSKEKYEEIRESILQQPFVCDSARAWRPEITCDDPADISQDGSRLWAIDKPNISQPPPGWQRLLRIRGEGSTKFADVYYATPSGKKLRSMVEVQKYLLEHPEYIRAGVTMTQFSFQIPKPLQDDYVRKRPARVNSSDGAGFSMSRPFEPAEVNPLSWASPLDSQHMQISSEPGQSTSYFEGPDFNLVRSPAKKQKTKSLAKKMHNNQSEFQVEEPQASRNNPYDL